MKRPRRIGTGTDVVAVILAVGLTLAVLVFLSAVMRDAFRSTPPGLDDNAAQVLTGALGGIIGLLGGYLGARHANRPPESSRNDETDPAGTNTPDGPD